MEDLRGGGGRPRTPPPTGKPAVAVKPGTYLGQLVAADVVGSPQGLARYGS